MKFYRMSDAMDGVPYYTTLEEAKKAARFNAVESYHDIVVDEIEVSTDKANILRLLNVAGGTDQIIRTVYTAKAKLKRWPENP
jgi:hypothetical protein